MTSIAVRKTQVSRPLKVLMPLIQGELQMGNDAGQEHYRRAGVMLIEAKEQVGYGGWGKWLRKNFDLSHDTASIYMRLAEAHRDFSTGGRKELPRSMSELRGKTERER